MPGTQKKLSKFWHTVNVHNVSYDWVLRYKKCHERDMPKMLWESKGGAPNPEQEGRGQGRHA